MARTSPLARRTWGLLALAVSVALTGCEIGPGGPDADEILWDTWGVPHVYGTTHEALFRGFGWAQAQAHGDLILRLYGESRGRAAEYWGEDRLDSDRWVRAVDVPGLARSWMADQSPAMRTALQAFAAGINAYALAHPRSLSEEARRVLPVEAVDVLAHGIRALHFTFVVNPGVTRLAQRTLLESGDERTGAVELPGAGLGSNAWAVAPSRSASGNALLLANPHLPWSDLFTWVEAQLVAPGVDVSGATLVGLPIPAIGFNDRLGWTHTVNTYDGADLYVVEVSENGAGYRFDGEVRPFETRQEAMRVRQDDGSTRIERMTVRSTVHGPVVAMVGGRAAALRVAGLDAPGVLEQWWDMGRAHDLETFESALRRLQIPMFNVVYADADGHVLYLFNGRVPRRPRGDVAFWSGPVSGDSSATLWNEVLPYDSLPRLLDPPTGWVQNANDPPWTAALPSPLDPAAFPAYLAPDYMHFRAQRSAELLRTDSSITFDELLRYKHSTRMLLADRILDDLLPPALEASNPAVRRGAEVLEAWDRTADAESRGGVLFLAWAERWLPSMGAREGLGPVAIRARVFAEPWESGRPASTPDGIAADTARTRALQALASAVRVVESEYGAADVAWGEVHRLRRGRWDLPANGADGDPGGVFRVTGYVDGPDGTRTASFGDSYVAAVEFTPDGPRARALLSYGNWSQPGSPHDGDQLELFSRKELRPVWRSREEVEANLERREAVPGPGG